MSLVNILPDLMLNSQLIMQGSPLTSTDFSYSSLFMKADTVVKVVMIGLALASIWSWAIIVDKGISFHLLKKRADNFEETFWSGRTLDELSEGLKGEVRDPMARIFAAAMREWNESRTAGMHAESEVSGTRDRVDRVMGLIVNRELTKAERGMTVLATIGSASVFVGLFGTVWGIMNSFRAIALSQNTNLAVVAPGIAEALFATALGLVAAIPATVFYNKYTADLDKYAGRLDGYTDELSAILSRKIGKAS